MVNAVRARSPVKRYASGTQGSRDPIAWLESALPSIMRRLLDADDLESPFVQLPLAQMRFANALYNAAEGADGSRLGETMGRLSERLGVRQNAATQLADRVIAHGLAERIDDERDRRIVRMRLTPKGVAWVEARRARRRAKLEYMWHSLDHAERKAFLRAVRTLESASDCLAQPTGRAGKSVTSDAAAASIGVEELLSDLATGQGASRGLDEPLRSDSDNHTENTA